LHRIQSTDILEISRRNAHPREHRLRLFFEVADHAILNGGLDFSRIRLQHRSSRSRTRLRQCRYRDVRRTGGRWRRFLVGSAFRNGWTRLLFGRRRRTRNPVRCLRAIHECTVKRLPIRIDVNHHSLKFPFHHLSRIATAGNVAFGRSRDVGSGHDRAITFVPRECSVSGRISVRVSRARPNRGVAAPRKVIQNEGSSVFGALIDAAVRVVREQQPCTQNKNASPNHKLLTCSRRPRAILLAGRARSGKERKRERIPRFTSRELSATAHLVTKLDRAAVVSFHLHQMQRDVSVELLEERCSITNQDRKNRITNFVG